MKQINIYYYLGLETDPIFNIIERLKLGQIVAVGGARIQRNMNGLYELESESYHECFKSEQEVYEGLSRMI